MKRVLTAIQVNIEMSLYNDEGQLVTRPEVKPVVVFQADIPEEFAEWILSKTQQSGG